MDQLPQITGGSATRIIQLIQASTSPSHIRQIQAQLLTQNFARDTYVVPHFIRACQSLSLLDVALNLITRFKKTHTFVCNALIRAFAHSRVRSKPLYLYTFMCRNFILSNHMTFPLLLKSFSDFRELTNGMCLHSHVVKLGHSDDVYVQNSLLNLYAGCGQMGMCFNVFDEMAQRDVVSWTVLVAGNRMAGKYTDALVAFEKMVGVGVAPNEVAAVNALAACAKLGAVEMGQWIYDWVRESGWELDVILGTSLVDMFCKCRKVEEAVHVFDRMRVKNSFTWNSMIKGLALAGNGQEAVRYFYRMEQEGIQLDAVSVLNALFACNHSGLVRSGREIFDSLIDGRYDYDLEPNVRHYACMIDLLARAGCLSDALQTVKQMPFKPTKVVWQAFLAGCRAHGNLELSEMAAWRLVELEPLNVSYYVLLSNLYAQMGRWEDVEGVGKLMKARGLRKSPDPGASG
uniref:Pentatricopeptide repeat-containing protein n=1 Tax=Kalanchoe fedtschenkoi TaxID=63787 RepID=A0A7N0VGK8_KALFE